MKVKTDKNFKLSKSSKRMILLTKVDKNMLDFVKQMYISAEVSEENANRTVTALRCGDGSSMWAGY